MDFILAHWWWTCYYVWLCCYIWN